jgi:hypothetical protein
MSNTNGPATEAQRRYLRALGYTQKKKLTMDEASRQITKLERRRARKVVGFSNADRKGKV